LSANVVDTEKLSVKPISESRMASTNSGAMYLASGTVGSGNACRQRADDGGAVLGIEIGEKTTRCRR
jgi:hypothetical protein